jgi:general stress protein YciG
MADNQGRGGNRGGGSSDRGFASMDDEKQREIARKGGEASAEKQRRDDEGQFAGTGGRGGSRDGSSDGSSGGSSGGSSRGSGGSSQGSSGGSSERGFAAMDDEKQREIARKGGQASGQSRSGSNR